MKLAVFIALLAILPCSARKKDRDWQVGRVVDSKMKPGPDVTVQTTDRQTSNQGIGGPMPSNTGKESVQTTTVSGTAERPETMIVGREYVYTIRNLALISRSHAVIGSVFGAAQSAVKRTSCRFVIGEDVKYAQDRSVLHILDADGRECSAEIVRQERIPTSDQKK